MNRPLRCIFVAAFRAVLLASPTALAACSDSGESVAVSLPASQRTDLDAAMLSAGHVKLPDEAAFNVHSFQSHQEGGARGVCQSVGNNGTEARAEVRNGGSAWAEFQLGYALDQTASSPLAAVVKVRLDTVETLSPSRSDAASRPAEVRANCNAVLAFFIKDSNGAVLGREGLSMRSRAAGAVAYKATHELAFDAILQPGLGYYLFLHGRVDAAAPAGCAEGTALEVSNLTVSIEWRPQPAAP